MITNFIRKTTEKIKNNFTDPDPAKRRRKSTITERIEKFNLHDCTVKSSPRLLMATEHGSFKMRTLLRHSREDLWPK